MKNSEENNISGSCMQNSKTKNQLKGAFSIPIALAIILVPFSMLIGWSLLTLLLFWFALVPALAVYLPFIISKNKHHVTESLAGLMIFYAGIIFMIYKDYKTDYFLVMIISFAINIALVTLRSITGRPRTQLQ
jgi:hypothetical protein